MNPLHNLKQDATIWTVVPDGFGGFTYGSPTPVKCRWEEKSELIPGSTELSRAVVYLSQDISPEDYVIQGISAVANPTTIGASRIIHFQKVPDLRNLNVLRKVWL